MRRIVLLTAGLMLWGLSSLAQAIAPVEGLVVGHVRSSKGVLPSAVARAVCQERTHQHYGVSNGSGCFSVAVPVDEFPVQLQVELHGYEPQEITVDAPDVYTVFELNKKQLLEADI